MEEEVTNKATVEKTYDWVIKNIGGDDPSFKSISVGLIRSMMKLLQESNVDVNVIC